MGPGRGPRHRVLHRRGVCYKLFEGPPNGLRPEQEMGPTTTPTLLDAYPLGGPSRNPLDEQGNWAAGKGAHRDRVGHPGCKTRRATDLFVTPTRDRLAPGASGETPRNP